MTQINIKKIKKELTSIRDFNSLKKEIQKLIKDIEKNYVKKNIPPAQLDYIEKKYKELIKTITQVQDQLEHEFDVALQKVNQTKEDALGRLQTAQEKAYSHKKEIEKMISQQIRSFSSTGKKKKTTKKKKKATTKKKTKKKVAKKKVTKAKTTKRTTKKKTPSKKK